MRMSQVRVLSWAQNESNMYNLYFKFKTLVRKLGSPFVKLYRYVRGRYRWIIKSIGYARLLKDDVDWDYAFLLLLISYKLKRMRKCISSNNIILRAPVIASEIRHVEKLIEKFREDSFFEDAIDKHNEKWGHPGIIKSTDGSLSTWGRNGNFTNKERLAEVKERARIYDESAKYELECWNAIFDSIKTYGRGWWD